MQSNQLKSVPKEELIRTQFCTVFIEKNMILLDMNQITITSLLSETKGKIAFDENLLRHLIVNQIRIYRNKFKNQYGEIVLCYDSDKRNWRKDIFAEYKFNRKKKDNPEIWEKVFDFLHKMQEELKENFPYKVLKVDHCEADDVIAVLSKKALSNNEKTVIVSNDKDFEQLINASVHQYRPYGKQLITEKSKNCLFEHIMNGDSSDGVPNVLSADDCFSNKKRQTPLTEKRYKALEERWSDSGVFEQDRDILQVSDDENIKKNVIRNQKMIDFNFIPDKYIRDIDDAFNNYQQPKNNILNYFMEKKMKMLLDNITEF